MRISAIANPGGFSFGAAREDVEGYAPQRGWVCVCVNETTTTAATARGDVRRERGGSTNRPFRRASYF